MSPSGLWEWRRQRVEKTPMLSTLSEGRVVGLMERKLDLLYLSFEGTQPPAYPVIGRASFVSTGVPSLDTSLLIILNVAEFMQEDQAPQGRHLQGS